MPSAGVPVRSLNSDWRPNGSVVLVDCWPVPEVTLTTRLAVGRFWKVFGGLLSLVVADNITGVGLAKNGPLPRFRTVRKMVAIHAFHPL